MGDHLQGSSILIMWTWLGFSPLSSKRLLKTSLLFLKLRNSYKRREGRICLSNHNFLEGGKKPPSGFKNWKTKKVYFTINYSLHSFGINIYRYSHAFFYGWRDSFKCHSFLLKGSVRSIALCWQWKRDEALALFSPPPTRLPASGPLGMYTVGSCHGATQIPNRWPHCTLPTGCVL